MPIYQYEREDGEIIEVNQRITEDPLETCPESGLPVKRIISQTAFHLKGNGWYKTDYASSSGSTSEASSSNSSSEKTDTACTGPCANGNPSACSKSNSSTD